MHGLAAVAHAQAPVDRRARPPGQGGEGVASVEQRGEGLELRRERSRSSCDDARNMRAPPARRRRRRSASSLASAAVGGRREVVAHRLREVREVRGQAGVGNLGEGEVEVASASRGDRRCGGESASKPGALPSASSAFRFGAVERAAASASRVRKAASASPSPGAGSFSPAQAQRVVACG